MDLGYPLEVPDLVLRAKRRATELGFDLRPEGNRAGAGHAGPSACLDVVGGLLRALAASVRAGHIGEVGTGAGVGAAWLASGMASRSELVTVELQASLVTAAKTLFEHRDDVTVLEGDWREALSGLGPFDLLFFDGGDREALQPSNWALISSLVKVGGIMIFDDLTPEEQWPDAWHGRPDPKRELAFRSGTFISIELPTSPTTSLLLMVRNGRSSGD